MTIRHNLGEHGREGGGMTMVRAKRIEEKGEAIMDQTITLILKEKIP